MDFDFDDKLNESTNEDIDDNIDDLTFYVGNGLKKQKYQNPYNYYNNNKDNYLVMWHEGVGRIPPVPVRLSPRY